jgi:hypothetical protein
MLNTLITAAAVIWGGSMAIGLGLAVGSRFSSRIRALVTG